MKKTDFRRNLESLIISKLYACSDVKLAEAAAEILECDECPLKNNRCELGCESTLYDAITKEANHD